MSGIGSLCFPSSLRGDVCSKKNPEGKERLLTTVVAVAVVLRACREGKREREKERERERERE